MTDNQAPLLDMLERVEWAEFLAGWPPGSRVIIDDAFEYSSAVSSWSLLTPDLVLDCDHDSCGGQRTFTCEDSSPGFGSEQLSDIFLRYQCRNCQSKHRVYALRILHSRQQHVAVAIKIGEFPAFGARVPNRILKILGNDATLFLQGRRCENQALGIGAFSYYRRVIENQWHALLDALVKAAVQLNADSSVVQSLQRAQNETQFKKAIEEMTVAIPESLRIDGHNPLTLLHGALSQGLHELSDEQCLQLATSIRVVLGDFSDRLATAMRDRDELRGAVSRLLNRPADGQDGPRNSDG